MVAKISIGSSLYGALAYNGEKINKEQGRLLATNKIFNDGSGTVDIHRAMEDFLRYMPSAMRTADVLEESLYEIFSSSIECRAHHPEA